MVLHEATVRQLKSRVRGGNSYTLVHTVTYTSDMELVPDVWLIICSTSFGGRRENHSNQQTMGPYGFL